MTGYRWSRPPSVPELLRRMTDAGGAVPAPESGYLQFIQHETLIALAAEKGAVIRLLHRPGHFVVRGHPLATVWPPGAAEAVSRALRVAHITGSNRTLAQDLAFAVDQLVEIAIRALSPRRQRHVHGADLHRLARREPLQGHHAVATAPRSS